MYSQHADEPHGAAEQLVSYSVRLLTDGLAIGRAGNLSARLGDTVLITPSGVSYHDLTPADICRISADPGASGAGEDFVSSSETPMHLAIYAATRAGAVVHTHSPEVIALSTVCAELPAIHYAIADLGGPVRVAGYHRFGSDELARAAVAALEGRRAVILANHGAVTYGGTLAQAYERALLLEWLARVYRLAIAGGQPRLLSQAELAEVVEHARRRRSGHQVEVTDQPAGGAQSQARAR